MRLFELIDFKPKDTDRDHSDTVKKVDTAMTKGPLGGGTFGVTSQTDLPKRLNQVTKVAQAGYLSPDRKKAHHAYEIEDDGYLMYLKRIQGDDNPYFPRVHDLKIGKDKDTGRMTYRVNLEKLYDFENSKIANEEFLLSFIDRTFRGAGDDEEDAFSTSELLEFIALEIDGALQNGDDSGIKDPNLKSALQTIEQIKSYNKKFKYDMHMGNLMWRMTGNMPQLVIVDPLA